LLAIDDDAPFEAADGVPVFGRCYINLHLIPGLERTVGPAKRGLLDKILRFDDPMYRVAALILGVQLQENVGIRPNVLGNRSFYRDSLFGVIGCIAVMGEDWERGCQESYNQKGNAPALSSHRIPPLVALSVLVCSDVDKQKIGPSRRARGQTGVSIRTEVIAWQQLSWPRLNGRFYWRYARWRADGEEFRRQRHFMRNQRTLANVLRSPTLAASAAFMMRMAFLWLSHRGENASQVRFETVGLEAHLVASSLAAGKGFFGPYPRYQAVTACVAPVYPMLWALGEKLFHLTFASSVLFAQAMNCVFSAATCWPIFGIGNKVFGRGVGLASTWLWVFLPYAALFPLEWTWDQSLSAMLLAVIVFVALTLRESGHSLALTGYGLLWALAALTNPTLCILMPFLLGWSMLRRGSLGGLSLASTGKVMLIFVLALLPWTIRNYYALDGFVFVKSNFGMELWLGNNPAVKEIYSPELHPMTNVRELIPLILNGEPNYNREKQREAIAFIEAHPRLFLKNVKERIEDTWAATYDSRTEPWIVMLGLSRLDVWFCTAFSVLAWAGMILALRSGWRGALPIATCLILFPLPYYITHTALRYRHPIDPLMAIFTTYAIARVWGAIAARRDRESIQTPLKDELEAVSLAG
jgi:hypothetical protein